MNNYKPVQVAGVLLILALFCSGVFFSLVDILATYQTWLGGPHMRQVEWAVAFLAVVSTIEYLVWVLYDLWKNRKG